MSVSTEGVQWKVSTFWRHSTSSCCDPVANDYLFLFLLTIINACMWCVGKHHWEVALPWQLTKDPNKLIKFCLPPFRCVEFTLNLSITCWMFVWVWKADQSYLWSWLCIFFCLFFLFISDIFDKLLTSCHASEKQHHRTKLNNKILIYAPTNAYEKFLLCTAVQHCCTGFMPTKCSANYKHLKFADHFEEFWSRSQF